MNRVIVLAMHGMTPKDFPKEEKLEYMRLRSQFHSDHPSGDPDLKARFEALEYKMRNWPRHEKNDPFFHASMELARQIEKLSESKVLVGFNEFCAPDIDQTLEQAVRLSPEEIVVTTPMLTPGGHHSEEEIPEIIETFRKKNPHVSIKYAWPFEIPKIATFLNTQIEQAIESELLDRKSLIS